MSGGGADRDGGARPAAEGGRPVVVGVAGGSGSGKTTVVEELVRGVAPEPVALLHHDDYYHDFGHLPEDERADVNFDHPSSLETGLLVEHLRHLADGEPVEVPLYDFRRHTRTGEVRTVEPSKVVIVDGILVLAEPDLRELMDIRIYVDTDADLRFIRRFRRDVEERGRSAQTVIEQYLGTVRPMHQEFVEPSKRLADVIVPRGGHNRVAVDMLVARVKAVLEGR